MLLCAAFFTLHSSLFTSCSEDDATEDEYADWQLRNEVFFASLSDSLSANPAQWQRILNYSLSGDADHDAASYIYVKKLEQGTGTESPCYTDSVRLSYQGRLIPTTTYPEGHIFDSTLYGSYSLATTATAKQVVSGVVDGFATAVQHMHCGDRWRVYIPYQLGYGKTEQNSIPAYSTLIFDITLVDFCHAGEVLKPWS